MHHQANIILPRSGAARRIDTRRHTAMPVTAGSCHRYHVPAFQGGNRPNIRATIIAEKIAEIRLYEAASVDTPTNQAH